MVFTMKNKKEEALQPIISNEASETLISDEFVKLVSEWYSAQISARIKQGIALKRSKAAKK
jgi:hypothetical protein